jgi:hypothetical protein
VIPPGAVAVDGGNLPLGGGLLALLRPALELLPASGVLAVLSSDPRLRQDLPSWCRAQRHSYRGVETLPDGRDCHRVERGVFSVPRGAVEHDLNVRPTDGRFLSAAVLNAVPMPERADATSGFAPRGARVEPGGPAYPFSIVDRDRAAPPEVAQLYDQAVASQWDASRDIPWERVGELAAPLEAAVGQVMTFLAENELAALYVPASFIPRIHPAFAETAMFLATQLNDEARHIDAFLKRARAGRRGLGVSSVTTSRSLLSLLEQRDFTESAFLLNVLGEGTFLDLLRFVEEHAPDAATEEVCRRARMDESRHVHFGLCHVRHGLSRDPALFERLEAAVRRRAATLHGIGEVPAPLQDALTILAAGDIGAGPVSRGHDRFRQLLVDMEAARARRLESAGFTPEQASTLSGLHTPNFM